MNPRLLWISRAALGVATAIALFLAWGTLNGGAPGCGDGGCSDVLASGYSRLLGLPVALFGAAVYILVIVSARRLVGSGSGPLEIAGRVACLLVVGFAIWFTALQLSSIGLCALCCAAHAFAVAGVAMIAWAGLKSEGGFRPRRFGVAAGAAAALFVAGIALQRSSLGDGSGVAPAVVQSGAGLAKIAPAAPIKEITLYGQTVDIGALPIIGSRDAKHVAVALLDPTCKGCRLVEPMLDGLQSLYGDKLAIVLAPGVRGEESEAIQRTLLGVWHHDADAYSALLAKLTGGEIKSTRTAVESAAIERIGDKELKASYVAKRAEINRAISFAKTLLAKNRSAVGQGSLPQLMVGDEIIVGGHSSARYYSNVIDRQLGLSKEDHLGGIGPALQLADGGVMHLGEIAPGEEHEFEVMVRNDGDQPLEIAWLNLPPGCAVKESPTGSIAPDRGASIQLLVRAPEKEGVWEDSLEIHHNGGGASESLRLLAMVKPADR